MHPSHDRLTLQSLLSDPLTQLVMLSDNITAADVANAFAAAQTGARLAGRCRREGKCPGAAYDA